MRKVHIPVRREELFGLAFRAQEEYRGMTIDEIAVEEGIILVRQPSEKAASGGFAYSEIVWQDGERVVLDAIVINPEYVNPLGERVSQAEIFWHEFYHLWYSPSRVDTVLKFFEYSTRGVLHAQEERRAEEFAVLVIVEEILPDDTPDSIAERYGITHQAAVTALGLLKDRAGKTGA